MNTILLVEKQGKKNQSKVGNWRCWEWWERRRVRRLKWCEYSKTEGRAGPPAQGRVTIHMADLGPPAADGSHISMTYDWERITRPPLSASRDRRCQSHREVSILKSYSNDNRERKSSSKSETVIPIDSETIKTLPPISSKPHLPTIALLPSKANHTLWAQSSIGLQCQARMLRISHRRERSRRTSEPHLTWIVSTWLSSWPSTKSLDLSRKSYPYVADSWIKVASSLSYLYFNTHVWF